ncbi:response regulator transcription factor [Fodinibius halophilus]|uniref:Response regulator transcription factor n=1 Tax=Fodinibius halophilus TaxID=1736908 RepID=A0A6M1T7E7_9BACT|nr:response regulator transcription factor [Fodinibius halophilus]NGP90137.1 response regulator transcription factor [Fodinibius halophilus]
MWILLVEDEKQLASSVQRGLEEEGHVVEVMHDGEQAELQGLVNDYDVVILDWRLPNRDGKQILEHWRAEDRTFPVLMLTALSDLDHKVSGLDAGADDYMSKPFSFEELLARIRALGRRSSEMTNTETVSAGPIELDARKHWVKVCGIKRSLRPKEFILLELLLKEPETVFSKTQIAERVWGSPYYVSDNTIEATISTLRQKLSESFEECKEMSFEQSPKVIETIRGAGYRLNSDIVNIEQDTRE